MLNIHTKKSKEKKISSKFIESKAKSQTKAVLFHWCECFRERVSMCLCLSECLSVSQSVLIKNSLTLFLHVIHWSMFLSAPVDDAHNIWRRFHFLCSNCTSTNWLVVVVVGFFSLSSLSLSLFIVCTIQFSLKYSECVWNRQLTAEPVCGVRFHWDEKRKIHDDNLWSVCMILCHTHSCLSFARSHALYSHTHGWLACVVLSCQKKTSLLNDPEIENSIDLSRPSGYFFSQCATHTAMKCQLTYTMEKGLNLNNIQTLSTRIHLFSLRSLCPSLSSTQNAYMQNRSHASRSFNELRFALLAIQLFIEKIKRLFIIFELT